MFGRYYRDIGGAVGPEEELWSSEELKLAPHGTSKGLSHGPLDTWKKKSIRKHILVA